MNRLAYLLLLLALTTSAAKAQNEEAAPAKKVPVNKGKLIANEFCPYGTIGAPVGISVDDLGRVFVTETNRRTNGELDIRRHNEFLLGSLACRTVEDKRAFIRANYVKGAAGDANHDGVQDWRDLLEYTEKIHLLIDSDGDGKFDKKTLFAEGFNTEITGVAGGVLAFGGNVYTTIQPDLWKLTDTKNAGVADWRVSLSHGHGVHIGYGGHDMHGPTMGPDGRIYWSQGDKGYSIKSREGKEFGHQYEGAVFRVNPDGSNLEVFAYGLRNPQELAFDDSGNLFSVDNDADIGDRERFVYIVQDSDAGWRATYQYRNQKIPGISSGGYNPWMAEELWKTKFETQAAYIVPPLANYSDGPCGFKFNPGTALSEEYKGHFFLTHFPKKLLTTFRAEPDGAGFKMASERVAFSGLMMTGIAFGPDGAIYSADWGENAWAPHQKGRVVKIDVPGNTPSGPRVETQRLLREGMGKRDLGEVVGLLGYVDQRIRLRAQFELVKHGREGLALLKANARVNGSLLARVHAIWGVGQFARMDEPSAAEALGDFLKDKEPEVRAQAAKMVGDASLKQYANSLAGLLEDESPRVRMLAGIALSKVARPGDLPAMIAMVERDRGRDAFVRHAGIVAMVGACANDAAPLAALAKHPERQVRLAAVVALRRLGSPLVEAFLEDKDQWVALEAGRAIHDDTSIPAALPALAKMLERAGVTNEALLRRAINANLRLGDAACAARLAAFATSAAPGMLRADALVALGWFAVPPKLDRVEGRYRDLPARDEKIAQGALDPLITRLLNDPAPAVRNASVRAIEQLHFDAARDRLTAIAFDEAQSGTLRGVALLAIHALKSPKTAEAVAMAEKAPDPRLRAAAITVRAQLEPDSAEMIAALKGSLEHASSLEQRAALAALGSLKSKEAAAVLMDWMQRLAAGKVLPTLQLDVLEAATASKEKNVLALVKTYQVAKPKGDKLAPYIEAMEGGDVIEGEMIFKSGQCTQCHLVAGSGGNVGPDLTHVGSRLTRRDLLESIVVPNAKIAEGFATISVTTTDGETQTGTLQPGGPDEVVLKDADRQIIKIKKADIESQTQPSSAMPPMAEVMKAREIRDVVAYLSGLR